MSTRASFTSDSFSINKLLKNYFLVELRFLLFKVHSELSAEEVVAAAAPLNLVITAPVTETASISLTLAKSEVPEEEFDGIYLGGDEFEDAS